MSVIGFRSWIISATIASAVSVTPPLCARNAAPDKVAIALRAADACFSSGDSSTAVTLLQNILPVAAQRPVSDQFTVLHDLSRILALNNDKRVTEVDTKLVALVDRSFKMDDYRRIYAHLVQSVDAGLITNDLDTALRDAPRLIDALQSSAKGESQISEAAAIGANYAELIYAHGQENIAIKLYEASIRLIAPEAGKTNRSLADANGNLMPYYVQRGKFKEAINAGRKSIEMYRALNARGAITYARALSLEADYLISEQPAEAENLAKESISVSERLAPRDHEALLIATYVLAKIYDQTGHSDLAEPLFSRAAELSELTPPSSSTSESILSGVARFYIEHEKLEKARGALKQAMVRGEKKPMSPGLARIYYSAGTVEQIAGNLPLALEYATKSRDIYQKAVSPTSAMNASPLALMARVAEKKGDLTAAAEYWTACLGYLTQFPYPDRNRELAAVSASFAKARTNGIPDWATAREAADSLTGRIVTNGTLALPDAEFTPTDARLLDQMLDIGWASQ